MNMTQIQILTKIDHVFLKLKEQTNLSASVNYNYIKNLIVDNHPEYNIDALTLSNIIAQLIKDEYLSVQKATNKDEEDMYYVTFQGQLFEGYLAQYRNKMANSNRIKKLEDLTLENAKKLNTLTTWIAIGTIIAAVYYVIEIIKNFLPNKLN